MVKMGFNRRVEHVHVQMEPANLIENDIDTVSKISTRVTLLKREARDFDGRKMWKLHPKLS